MYILNLENVIKIWKNFYLKLIESKQDLLKNKGIFCQKRKKKRLAMKLNKKLPDPSQAKKQHKLFL